MNLTWQRSSYCSEGNSCIHVAATPSAIHITETSDPTGAILTTTPGAFAAFLTALKSHTHPTPAPIEVTFAEDDETVRIRSTTRPDTVVTTDRPKWDAFVLGVRAGEFDWLPGEARQVTLDAAWLTTVTLAATPTTEPSAT